MNLDFKLVMVGEYLRPCTAQRASAHSEDWPSVSFRSINEDNVLAALANVLYAGSATTKRRLTAKVKREKGASGATWRWSLDIVRPAVIVGS